MRRGLLRGAEDLLESSDQLLRHRARNLPNRGEPLYRRFEHRPDDDRTQCAVGLLLLPDRRWRDSLRAVHDGGVLVHAMHRRHRLWGARRGRLLRRRRRTILLSERRSLLCRSMRYRPARHLRGRSGLVCRCLTPDQLQRAQRLLLHPDRGRSAVLGQYPSRRVRSMRDRPGLHRHRGRQRLPPGRPNRVHLRTRPEGILHGGLPAV